jgi:hypothetical protein
MVAPQTRYTIRRLSYYGHLLAVSAAALLVFVVLVIPEGPNVRKADTWIIVLFFLFTLYGVYTFVAMPRSVELTADGALKFDSLLGTRIAAPSELRSITTGSMGYYVVFRFAKAKVALLNRIDGLYELVSYLKSQKPELVVKGL